jgi:hypothetical protein
MQTIVAVAKKLGQEMSERDECGQFSLNELHFFPQRIPPPMATLAADQTVAESKNSKR